MNKNGYILLSGKDRRNLTAALASNSQRSPSLYRQNSLDDSIDTMEFMHFVLRSTIGRATSRLPSLPGSLVFAAAINPILKNHMSQELETRLHGKFLRFSVTDLMLDFNVLWTREGLVATWNVEEPDLTVSAGAHDFILLALGHEDADSLFFRGSLLMEGDTELGVLLKNMVDQLELDMTTLVHFLPVGLLSFLFAKRNGRN